MKKTQLLISIVCLLMLSISTMSWAHFGAVIPSDATVTKDDPRMISLEVKFVHPMERHYMEMVKPKRFGVLHRGKTVELLNDLQPQKGKASDQDQQFTFWKMDYAIQSPGDYTFFVEPTPYWEPAEDLFIVHYTKVCVNALGLEEGWDEPVGLQTEIVPLTRPYGLWTGNVFQGQVLLNGKPAPCAEVEIEYLNPPVQDEKAMEAPADPFVTQVVRADGNGIFTYAMPRAGWWGFSALSEASWKLKHEGEEKSVEIGAVYWVHATDME
jgi:cobalt/nickel transport protein